MECNKTNARAKYLTYGHFPEKFVWLENSKTWKIREKGTSVGRIYHASPDSGERYFLRILLNHIKGPTSYEELRTIKGVVYSTFKEACYALGLLDDDKEYIDGITEASFWGSTDYVRSLFVLLFISNSMSRPDFVWERKWKLLADDIVNKQRRLLRIVDLQLSDVQLQNYALAEIEKLLQRNGSSLRNFNTMPIIDQGLLLEGVSELILEELRIQQGTSATDRKEAKEFSEWILSIDDGTISDDNDGETQIEILDELLGKNHDLDPIPAIVKSIYPSISHFQVSPKYFEERAILAPTHEEVDKVNDFILYLLPDDEKVYLSSDSLYKAVRHAVNDESVYTSNYLNTIRCSGVPNHVLKVKIRVPIMLLRNIDQSSGL
ncbi:hypothetical protein V2J09_012428 [Rumex salicifolius]